MAQLKSSAEGETFHDYNFMFPLASRKVYKENNFYAVLSKTINI